MAFEKYDLTVKPYGLKKVNVEQELPSGRRIPYMKPLPLQAGGKVLHSVDNPVKPAWMRNR
jgi:hypothetical protein|tara:strand:+ start:833 stop:1015 length:183 start_codon:yes stop_codon:yes gene_type:complete